MNTPIVRWAVKLALAFVLAGLAWVVFPSVRSEIRDRAWTRLSLSNHSLYAVGIQNHAASHHDLALRSDDPMDLLPFMIEFSTVELGIEQEILFSVYRRGERAKGSRSDYVLTPALVGRGLSTVEYPSKTIVAMDVYALEIGKRELAVALADGSARLVDVDGLNEMLAEPWNQPMREAIEARVRALDR